MIKILSIGNSFSQDAQRYLHGIFNAMGEEAKTVNLYIGGCRLATHYKNINNDASAYGMEFNGVSTGFMVSVKEALQSDEWDYVTLQQQSSSSADYRTFQPYLNVLADYVDFHAPHSEIVLHQTWSYEPESQRLYDAGYTDHKVMFGKIRDSYNLAKKDIGTNIIIPCGQTMQNIVESGVRAYRDGFHAGLGCGRFALGLTWYGMLTGKSFGDIKFDKFDTDVTPDEYKTAVISAEKAVNEYK